ncbi:DUF1236 domain-containing protein [Mesorhizobium sp. CO1-1-7]|uniref:DUF1236 domain-containing protein n=1 Tax=Mesorhizobium australicum (strain HAMBI 3006 / LMG 24608 / WSM2073) TaxID=754035 RepID=L0KLI3_MESAW|nr:MULTISPECIES: DUF1236 domain-containing protein [Mesorhizobium]MBZ9930236.1 DUF1236 domain-containing protein [Mesorhizobium sp. BR1-1-5]AGB45545.1 Protein of unknown function (DUF1236) [Mesorhizobium australicum WSM2073]MBZ9696211.1 DUF1236 domain-containing protein [Mesorhizobium sp. CO1-1-9]MBZ9723691.1 DUF1236 domain-containing protein [Mesorhizobium sp. CO1-1-11]MBZ9746527.1 DUF1236 domain-containing protein [Mesorhizobium sp. CO1-1-7]
MKRYLVGAVAALALMAGIGASFAGDVVILKPEQQTVVREYIHKQKLASVSLLGVELNVGSALPDTVELHTIDVPDVRYKYTVVGDHAVLVDPDTRRVVQIIE